MKTTLSERMKQAIRDVIVPAVAEQVILTGDFSLLDENDLLAVESRDLELHREELAD